MPPRQIHQPIHPTIRPLLDPKYVTFHDTHFQYLLPDDQKPWDGSARLGNALLPRTENPPVPVGSVRNITLPSYHDLPLRIFTPSSQRPAAGWPVFLWLHGGGWVVGDVSHNNDLCALICQRAGCVVVTVGYRLAPEFPYPAAFEDSVYALRWVSGEEGGRELGGVDVSRVAVGGLSAGGQLAASLALEASRLEMPVKLAFQLLIVPVIDSTATTETIWAKNQHAPWLTPARMTWYRGLYFGEEEGEKVREWQASPNFAPVGLLAKSPRTWIAVGEQDLLAPEAEAYGKQLGEAWEQEEVEGEVVVKSYEGSTHSILALNGVLAKGKQLLEDAADQAAAWFST